MALLSAHNATLVARSGAWLELGNLQAPGSRLLLLGDFLAFIDLCNGAGKLHSGSLQILDKPIAVQLRAGAIALCDAAAPLPQHLSVLSYLEEALRLNGRRRQRARLEAESVCADFGLAALKHTATAHLRDFERLGLALAALSTADPRVLVLANASTPEMPEARAFLRRVLERVAEQRALIFVAPPRAGELYDARLLGAADAVWLAEAGKIRVIDAAYSLGRDRYVVTATPAAPLFFEHLQSLGCTVEPLTDPVLLTRTWLGPARHVGRAVVTLPAGNTGSPALLHAAAKQSSTTLLEILPL